MAPDPTSIARDRPAPGKAGFFHAGGGGVKLVIRLFGPRAVHAGIWLWLWRFWRRQDHLEGHLQAFRSEREGFEADVYAHWCGGIDGLDVVWFRSYEEVARFQRRFGGRARRASSAKYEALLRLHGRAARVTTEISTLLRGGHGDAAFARWRTLHEIAITMEFLLERDDDVAERYLNHDLALRAAAIDTYNRHAAAFGDSEVPADEHDAWKRERAALREKYGRRYSDAYGWANVAFPRFDDESAPAKKPRALTFADIEEAVERQANRPWFKHASNAVHANSWGLQSVVHEDEDGLSLRITPVGDDLHMPGVATVSSYVAATQCFLALYTDSRTVLARAFIESLRSRAVEEWEEAHRAVVGEEPGSTPVA